MGVVLLLLICVFFFKQKTAYEMRISDWSSDVCSSDLSPPVGVDLLRQLHSVGRVHRPERADRHRPELDGGGARAGAAAGDPRPAPGPAASVQIGRASCRERVCQYVSISVVAVSLQKKHMTPSEHTNKRPSHPTH